MAAGQPTKFPPRTIHLGGEQTVVNDVAAGVAITPGMLVERYTAAGGVPLFRPNTQTDKAGSSYALNQSMINLGVDDAYAIGDLVEVGIGQKGATYWALVASGANVANGALLGNAGNGKLKAVGAGIAIAIAVESKDNSAGPGDARIRVEVI